MAMPWGTKLSLQAGGVRRGWAMARRRSSPQTSSCVATSKPVLSLARDHFGPQSIKDGKQGSGRRIQPLDTGAGSGGPGRLPRATAWPGH